MLGDFSSLLDLPIWLLVIVSIWSIIWKGLALWKAAAVKKSVPWFIALLIINTVGILEILYIYIFSEMKSDKKDKKKRKKSKK